MKLERVPRLAGTANWFHPKPRGTFFYPPPPPSPARLWRVHASFTLHSACTSALPAQRTHALPRAQGPLRPERAPRRCAPHHRPHQRRRRARRLVGRRRPGRPPRARGGARARRARRAAPAAGPHRRCHRRPLVEHAVPPHKGRDRPPVRHAQGVRGAQEEGGRLLPAARRPVPRPRPRRHPQAGGPARRLARDVGARRRRPGEPGRPARDRRGGRGRGRLPPSRVHHGACCAARAARGAAARAARGAAARAGPCASAGGSCDGPVCARCRSRVGVDCRARRQRATCRPAAGRACPTWAGRSQRCPTRARSRWACSSTPSRSW